KRPSALMLGAPPPKLPCPPELSTLTRSVMPVWRSRTNASGSPFVSPGTRLDATDSNATNRPSALIADRWLWSLPRHPALLWLISSVSEGGSVPQNGVDVGVAEAVGVQAGHGVAVADPVGEGVVVGAAVPVGAGVRVGVPVAEAVAVGPGVQPGQSVGVAVAVAVGVAVRVAVAVTVPVAVPVAVPVEVGNTVRVGVGLAVRVAVVIGVAVGVAAAEAVGVAVAVGLAVAVGVAVAVGAAPGSLQQFRDMRVFVSSSLSSASALKQVIDIRLPRAQGPAF